MGVVPALIRPVLRVGAVVIRHNTVLLVKCADGPKRGFWSIPVTAMVVGESLPQILERYIAETTGMVVEGGCPVYSEDSIERDDQGKVVDHQTTIFLAARYISGNPVAGGGAEEVAWVSVEAMEFMEIDEAALLLLEALSFLELEDET